MQQRATAISEPNRRLDPFSSQWAMLIVALGWALAISTTLALHHQSPISCARAGSFSSDFSRDFDIVHAECKIPWVKHSPVLALFETSPRFILHWSE